MNIITDRFTLSTWSTIDIDHVGDTWQLWSVRSTDHSDRLGLIALPSMLATDEILAHPLVVCLAGIE